MRLLYNYSTANFAVFPEDGEDIFIKEIVTNGDAYSIYDISHWTGEDLMDFSNHTPEDQTGQLENLEEV